MRNDISMLSLTSRIAIKAVVYLSCQSEAGSRTGIKEVARHIAASEHTVGKILQTLARRKVIHSVKGPAGGFYLTEGQQNQALMRVVEAVDADAGFQACGLGLAACPALHPCPIHDEYQLARESMECIFREKTVRDLCRPVVNGMAFLNE